LTCAGNRICNLPAPSPPIHTPHHVNPNNVRVHRDSLFQHQGSLHGPFNPHRHAPNPLPPVLPILAPPPRHRPPLSNATSDLPRLQKPPPRPPLCLHRHFHLSVLAPRNLVLHPAVHTLFPATPATLEVGHPQGMPDSRERPGGEYAVAREPGADMG
jgi:hypothetical protein